MSDSPARAERINAFGQRLLGDNPNGRLGGFVPRISNVNGFLAYYVIDTGEGLLASVSVFETKEGEEESNRVAAAWVKETLSGMLGPVEITAGEVVAYKTK